ncbi:MAG TPA: Crp/Fnr family transcriptional regulator [Terriglobales bacterium]|jgi:CRP-like cAMP-binding protein|nr:Crp/Fnr family transcriptional regulator [Terriglobales bacterium]
MTIHDGRGGTAVRTRSDSKGRAIENGLLLLIPDAEFEQLRPQLEFVTLGLHQVLQDAGHSVDYGYFPNSGLASLLVVTSDAKSVEVSTVGNEGFIGMPLAAGIRDSFQRVIVQHAGDAFRVRAEILQTILPELPLLQRAINRYLLLQGMQVAQVAACNRLHEIEQRLARWLLMSHDRSGGRSFPITHDLLSQMLGSGRPSVTVAAGTLQRAGLIEYTRGMVKVLSRPGLEGAACECYDAIRRIGSN